MVNCCLCQDEFPDENELEIHLALEHVFYTPYQCEFCQLAFFPSDFALRRHYFVDHQQQIFNIIYRVSPNLDAKRIALQKLLLQSMGQGSKTMLMRKSMKNATKPSEVKNSIKCNSLQQFLIDDNLEETAQPPGSQTDQLNGCNDDFDPNETLCIQPNSHNEEETLLDEHLNNQDELVNGIEDSKDALFENKSPQAYAILQSIGTANATLSALTQHGSRMIRGRKRGAAQIIAEKNIADEDPTEAPNISSFQSSSICTKCNRSVAKFRNSKLLHISTHHCNSAIFECIACDKKWFSLAARTREHIENHHNGDMSLIKDNRSNLMDSLKEKLIEYFPEN